MRPLLFSSRFVSNFRGILLRRFASQHVATEKLTLTIPTKSTKQETINELKRHRISTPATPLGVSNGSSNHEAAVFASPDFATWLEDENFMSSLLRALFEENGNRRLQSGDSISVLSAVADGLTPRRLFAEPQTGLSILYSSNSILPNIWDKESGPGANKDRASSVSFTSFPLPGRTGPLEATLPLANTIFQNGRRSTLFVSRWQRKDNESMLPVAMHEKGSQIIRLPIDRVDHTYPLFPLLPLTPPRKVVAGLGNIVRQVEINGSSTPASKELEDLIPKVFDIRSKLDKYYTPGPMGVWCWVIPPHVMDEQNLAALKVFQAESTQSEAIQSEADLLAEAAVTFTNLLSSKCRLHKILSGGGGWGLKQGLLSLDPETNYSLSDQDDVDMFIKAFQERDKPGTSEGLVTPGSYLMFCIEPHWKMKATELNPRLPGTISLGVAPSNDEDANPARGSEKMEVIGDEFGIVSKSGLFLTSMDEYDLGSIKSGSTPRPPFTTKVSIPRASLVV
ncbi:hypothetical protein GGR52DRAFT_562971 [Hypoxylon sp. FL1284]|nr:hypothetical protein GGR52DRAFT_562971 [Hypoxylon sp. FL1284]